jgi:phage terminase small subunit
LSGFLIFQEVEVMENGMTEKQKIFADEYIIELNATKAYKKAYPNVKKDKVAQVNGSRLLSNAMIKAYIDERLEQLKSERVADQQEVLEFLTAVMRGEITEPLLVLDGDGYQKVMDAKPNVSTRKSAAVDLGKRYGLFVDRQEITQKTIDIKVGDWDDNEE